MIFIVSNRIEKIRLKRFKEKCLSKGLGIQEILDAKVTHIVSELDDVETVCSRLKLVGSLLEHVVAHVHIVNTLWLTACLRAGKLVQAEPCHLVPHLTKSGEDGETSGDSQEKMAEWACMRDTPLYHSNLHLTEALEVLEKDANFIGGETNYSRALAFRRCMATLAALPQKVVRVEEVASLPHVGGHCRQVIKEILEYGSSTEVDRIRDSDFHKTMKVLTGVFGVGEATAKKWINSYNVRSIDEARAHAQIQSTGDERLQYGLAFYEDLSLPVLASEANALRELVYKDASSILPGVTVEVTGGFRRGKSAGHDIDLLVSHPEDGAERGLLVKLLDRLFHRGLHLHGKVEGSSFTEERLSEDTKLNYLKSNLDHFEKFVGILKLNKDNRIEKETILTDKKQNADNSNPSTSCSISCNSSNKSSDERSDSSKNDQSKHSLHQGLNASMNHHHSAPIESQQRDVLEPRPKLRKQTTLTSLYSEALQDRKWYARRVDIVIAPASQYHYALVGWTGSKSFNRDLRLYASRVQNMKLTSHGLYDFSQKKSVPASSEQQVFTNLALEYRNPRLRNC